MYSFCRQFLSKRAQSIHQVGVYLLRSPTRELMNRSVACKATESPSMYRLFVCIYILFMVRCLLASYSLARGLTLHQADLTFVACQFDRFFDAPMFALFSLFFTFGLMATYMLANHFKGHSMTPFRELVHRNVRHFEVSQKCTFGIGSRRVRENVRLLWKGEFAFQESLQRGSNLFRLRREVYSRILLISLVYDGLHLGFLAFIVACCSSIFLYAALTWPFNSWTALLFIFFDLSAFAASFLNLVKFGIFNCYLLDVLSFAYGHQLSAMKVSLQTPPSSPAYQRVRDLFGITFTNNVTYHCRLYLSLGRYLQVLNQSCISPDYLAYFLLTFPPNVYILAHLTHSSHPIELFYSTAAMAVHISCTCMLLRPTLALNRSIYRFVGGALGSLQARQPNYGDARWRLKLQTCFFTEFATESVNGNVGFTVGSIARITPELVGHFGLAYGAYFCLCRSFQN